MLCEKLVLDDRVRADLGFVIVNKIGVNVITSEWQYYPLSYRVPIRERYGSTLLPVTREQHDQNCTQSH